MPRPAGLGDGKLDFAHGEVRGDPPAIEGSADQWFRLDTTASTGGFGGTNTMTVDASAYLDFLWGQGATVTKVGARTIGGLDTTQYRVEKTLAEMMATCRRAEQAKPQGTLPKEMSSAAYVIDVFVR